MNFPNLNGNWVDLLILFTLTVYLLSGWTRGFFIGILDLLGFIFSFVSALKFYSVLGLLLRNNFNLTKGIANALGFFLAGILSEIIYSAIINIIVNKVYSKLKDWTINKKIINLLKTIDNKLGIIPVLGEALIFTAFVLTLLITLPVHGKIKKEITSSKIGKYLINYTQGIEHQLNSVFGEAVNETLTFLTVNPNPASSESVDLGFIQKEGKVDSQAEGTMLTLVNIERQKNNLRPLESDSALKELARDYARDMFARGYFSHYNPEGQSPFDRMKNRNILFFVGSVPDQALFPWSHTLGNDCGPQSRLD